MADDNSLYIFDYLNDVWSLLSEQDQNRFAETWKGYEQTYGDIWMSQFQSDLANTIQYLPLYDIKRWLQHLFVDFYIGTLESGNTLVTGIYSTEALDQGIDVTGVGIPAGATIAAIIDDNTIQLSLPATTDGATTLTFEGITVTQVLLSATFTSIQDFSEGIDLSTNYLVNLSADEGSPVEIDLRGAVPSSTTLAEIVSKLNVGLEDNVASATDSNQLLQLKSTTVGPQSSFTFYPASNPDLDANGIVFGLDVQNLPLTVPEFPYAYQLQEADIVGIPTMQDTIHDDLIETLLTETTNYQVSFGSAIISFAEPPPPAMWAKNTLCNFETPYNNFGYLMGIYAPNTASYLKAVQGLWFAFWNGPSPENIKRSLYLLFGLPTASKPGSVTSVTDSTITLLYTDNSTESFTIPSGLIAVVAIGDTVNQYEPLVSGISVFDKINRPGFLADLIGRPAVQPFLTQFATRGLGPDTDETRALTLLEQNTYLPQIDVNAFISPNISISNVETFLNNINPKSRTYLLQVIVGIFNDPINVSDGDLGTDDDPGAGVTFPTMYPPLSYNIDFDATSNVDWNGNTMGNLAVWEDAETNPLTGLTLDDCGMCLGDFAFIEVYESAVLIDSFSIEG